MLLFAGDAGLESDADAQKFNAWLAGLPHPVKVVTFGNMDAWAAQRGAAARRKALPAATHVLVDEFADVAGYRIFASPFTPKFFGAFQLSDAEDAGAVQPQSTRWCEVRA